MVSLIFLRGGNMGFIIHKKNSILHRYYQRKVDHAYAKLNLIENKDSRKFAKWRHEWYINQQKLNKYPDIF